MSCWAGDWAGDWANVPTISGNVKNSGGLNLRSVEIAMENSTNYETSTNFVGNYSQQVDPDIYTVIASLPGSPDQSAIVDTTAASQVQDFIFPVTTAPIDKGIRLKERYLKR